MHIGLPENFIRGFLLLFIFLNGFLSLLISTYATSLNNSNEIKTIFSPGDNIKNAVHENFKGTFKNKNFAEGGLIYVNVISTTHISINKLKQNFSNNTNYSSTVSPALEKQYVTSLQRNVSKTSSSELKSSTYKTFLDTKLTDSGSNLFLGIPEVNHINGSSSVKPRKGVNYDKVDNKIVPRKGVENDNKKSNNFFSNHSCFQLDNNKCYNAEETHNIECSCCKEGNAQGEIFKQQALVNCNKCNPMFLSMSDKLVCENICCKSVFHDINSIVASQGNSEQSKNNSKLKPTVTKVPYDIEVVTEFISKAKQKVFVPIVVSLLILPVFGLFIFLIWRKTREYWDNRFYKRMDFLIDGMYND